MVNVTDVITEDDPSALIPVARPRPLGSTSLVASAKRLTTTNIVRMGSSGKGEAWQEDAWDMYDLVGEQRFLANTIAGRMSQARLFVGKMPKDPTDDVEPVTEGTAAQVFDLIGGRARSLQQIVHRAGINLFIAGDGFLLGVPDEATQEKDWTEGMADGDYPSADDGITPFGRPIDSTDSDDGQDEPRPYAQENIENFVWRFYAVTEIKFQSTGTVKVRGEGGQFQEYNLDSIVLIRVWREHPRTWWHSDSPTRSSLPVLRELVGLTMHISAQVDSRLAGAGMLLIPEEADRAVRARQGLPEEGEGDSPFVEALMETMLEPIRDRSAASAVVPIMPVVPADTVQHFKYISFAVPLDAKAKELRDEAIRRLALGEDCPPELLLGVSGMNHWGAWLVREDVVSTHIEPPLALFCDALTTQFLWPILAQQGMSKQEYEEYVVWYDVSHLIIRPNRIKDAYALHAVGVVGDDTLRDAAGFDTADAPDFATIANDDPVNTLALNLIRSNPALLMSPGLGAIVQQLQAMKDGQDIPLPPGVAVGNPDLEHPDAATTGAPGPTKPPTMKPKVSRKGPNPNEPNLPGPSGNDGADAPDDQGMAAMPTAPDPLKPISFRASGSLAARFLEERDTPEDDGESASSVVADEA